MLVYSRCWCPYRLWTNERASTSDSWRSLPICQPNWTPPMMRLHCFLRKHILPLHNLDCKKILSLHCAEIRLPVTSTLGCCFSSPSETTRNESRFFPTWQHLKYLKTTLMFPLRFSLIQSKCPQSLQLFLLWYTFLTILFFCPGFFPCSALSILKCGTL